MKRTITIPSRVRLAGLWLLAGLHVAVPAAAAEGGTPPEYAPFWMVLAGFAVILLALVVWNRRLAREITRRQGTEEMLLRVNKAVECASDAIGMADSQGRHFYQNKAFTDLFEYQTEEFNAPGGEPAGYVDKNVAREVFATIMSGGSWSGEVEMKSKSGRQFPVRMRADAIKDEDGRVIGLVGVHTDITEHQRTEEALRRSEASLQLALEAARLGDWSWDIVTGEIVWSARCKGLYGLSPETVVTYERFLNCLHPDDRQRIDATLRRAVAERSDYDVEKRAVWPDGSLHWNATRGRVFCNAAGEPVRVAGVTLDITERKRAEEALRASLEEKVILLKEVHHRVKNNLQIISSLLNLQARKVRSSEFQTFLQDTQNRIRAMALLHETLYGSGNLACVGFRDYVNNVCIHLARSYASDSKRIRIQQDIAEVNLPLDQAIPAGLIINELLTNAFKHAFAGRTEGKITVRLWSAEEPLHTLRVADNGVGLPAAETQDSGTLGLRLVASLVQQLEGRLFVERGAETVFQIAFPKLPR